MRRGDGENRMPHGARRRATSASSSRGTGDAPSAKASTSSVRVRYAETDQMGVVYYANYFVWFEVGRCEWLRNLGWSYREMEAEGLSLPVIAASCEYLRPTRYDDQLEVRTSGWLLSPVRIEFRYEVIQPSGASIAAVGHTIHAVMNARGRPGRLPERIRVAFS